MPDHIHMLVSIPAQNECIKLYGIFKGKIRINDIRPTCKSKV